MADKRLLSCKAVRNNLTSIVLYTCVIEKLTVTSTSGNLSLKAIFYQLQILVEMLPCGVRLS
jgi:hypothetical protein